MNIHMAPRKTANSSKDDNRRSNFIASNLSYLRQESGKTLDEVRLYAGLSGRSSYRAYEQGDALPSIHVLMKLASLFDVSLDELVKIDLTKVNSGDNAKSSIGPTVPIVPIKARAGYLSGFHDEQFINSLETIQIPYKPYGIARAFQIQGDSMEPEVSDGAYVVGVKIDRNELVTGKNYIVITKDGDVVYKMVMVDGDRLTLVSRNPSYQPKEIEGKNVKEMWRYYCHVNKTTIK